MARVSYDPDRFHELGLLLFHGDDTHGDRKLLLDVILYFDAWPKELDGLRPELLRALREFIKYERTEDDSNA